jgi:hypothetical protein
MKQNENVFALPTYFHSFPTSLAGAEGSTYRTHVGCYGNNKIIQMLRMTADMLWIIIAQGAEQASSFFAICYKELTDLVA